MALTPVAALMFRYNNPDAVMVLLMMAAAYCAVRALEHASAKWIALGRRGAGLRVPGQDARGHHGDAGDRPRLSGRGADLGRQDGCCTWSGALATFLVSAGWFVVLTLLWPASSRPYIAGSTDNNFMNLVLGYNGFARVLGKNHGNFHAQPRRRRRGGHPGRRSSTAATTAASAASAQPQGLTRLFTGEFGFEIGWLLPAALLAMVLVLISRGRAPRTDLVRAAAILFGGWMLVDGLVLSYMKTMVHPYYCLSFVPGGRRHVRGRRARDVGQARILVRPWRPGRDDRRAPASGAGGSSDATRDWLPALRWMILAVTVVAAVALLVSLTSEARQRFAVVVAGRGPVGGLLGAGAYAFATIGQSHDGGMAVVGPARDDGHRRWRWLRTGHRQRSTGSHAARHAHRLLGRHQPLVGGCRSRTVHEHRGDGHRRIRRKRPGADTGRVPAGRRQPPDHLLHRARQQPAPRRLRQPVAHRHHAMGGSPLRADDGRIRDRLRPHGAAELSDAITVNGPR